MEKKSTGIKRLTKASLYSYNGLLQAWKSEAAFRQEVIVALLLIPLTFWLSVNTVERVLLILVVVLVLIVELVNTAIEAVVNRFGTERHIMAGMAKDVASAAVMLSLLLCAFVWLSILLA